MSVIIPHRAIKAVSETKGDTKKAILDFIGDIDGIEVIGDMVLVAVYLRPERTAGGIIRPDMNKQEDVWQGKAGLVLKWGPDAFIDPNTGDPYEQRAEVGEWCVFKAGDGWLLNIRDYPCRLVRDTSIKLKVKDPSIIF